MRDILRSNKGRTASQRDYGHDAGDYVPVLERRTPRVIGSAMTADGRIVHSKHASRGWNSGALAQQQEDKAPLLHWRKCAEDAQQAADDVFIREMFPGLL